jgi:TRAP-type C4-dicarboxylate transport system permease small subunit
MQRLRRRDPAVESDMKRLEGMLVRTLRFIFGVCFFVMFALIVTQVVLRYGFSESIGGANELATILFAYTSALGIAVGIAERDHMAVSWFIERLPARARRTLDGIGLLLLLILNLVILWYSLRWIGITGSRMISVLHVPRWTAQIAIPIGTGASVVFCCVKLWLGLRGDEELGIPWMRDDR